MAKLSMLSVLIPLVFLMGMNPVGKVLVVGGGASGIAAAQRLQKHFQVTVYEVQKRLGGKCHSGKCVDNAGSETGGYVEFGAIQVGIGYPTVNRYRKEVGIKLRNYWPSRSLRWRDGTLKPIYQSLGEEYWPTRDAKEIVSEIATMSQALDRFAPIEESDLVAIDSDSEFAQPFEVWADNLGLSHFKNDFGVWITSYGYGQLRDVPAYLPLYLINSSLGLVAMRQMNLNLRMLEVGYGGLIERMVQHYKLDVRLGTEITHIDRLSDGIYVTATDQHGNEATEHFDHLIVASGLESVPNLFKKGMTPKERALVEDLRFSPYDVVIARIPGLEKGGYVLPQNLPHFGHVTLISKNSAGGDEVILYLPRQGVSTAQEIHDRPSEADLEKAVRTDMMHFGFDEVEILSIHYWDNYFPHFNSPKSYRLLKEIQGENNTLFVGSMGTFEIVEKAMKHAHNVVDEHLLRLPAEEKGYIETAKDFLITWYDYFAASGKDEQ